MYTVSFIEAAYLNKIGRRKSSSKANACVAAAETMKLQCMFQLSKCTIITEKLLFRPKCLGSAVHFA